MKRHTLLKPRGVGVICAFFEPWNHMCGKGITLDMMNLEVEPPSAPEDQATKDRWELIWNFVSLKIFPSFWLSVSVATILFWIQERAVQRSWIQNLVTTTIPLIQILYSSTPGDRNAWDAKWRASHRCEPRAYSSTMVWAHGLMRWNMIQYDSIVYWNLFDDNTKRTEHGKALLEGLHQRS